MALTDWFSQRESRRYTKSTPDAKVGGSGELPDGVWVKCEECKHALYEGELAENHRVCRYCGHHLALTAPERIALLADEGSFAEVDADLAACDPLEFAGPKPYTVSLESARAKSELADAIMVGRALVGGTPVVLGAMDFRFIGASMGSVVGEKVARAFELAIAERRPVVLAIASGGARMQEGMLSLMQMAKTAAAAQRLADAGLPFISVLTNPTYGGVTASFAVLADVVVAEPGAVIGFAGPRVIEQTIRQKLPKGFRTSESMLAHGMIDEIVPRGELAEHLALLLEYLRPRAVAGGER
jgi:acetyl-CoA carboxylase carboxyl transferase subunit beta